MLRREAAPLRTSAQILKKNEEILDGLERGTVTPKAAEQMSQCCKLPLEHAKFELKYHGMVRKFGRTAPVPRSPLTRELIGLAAELSAGDGPAVRQIAGE